MAIYHWEALEEMDLCGAPYFTLNVATTAVRSQLVIPAAFTSKTAWPGVTECTLVVSLSGGSSWPVQFQLPVKKEDGMKVEAVSVGMGWSRFMHDMKIELDNVLVFEVVDGSSLVVSIYPHFPLPCFTKKLKTSHKTNRKTGKMDIPTSFWRDLGEEKFDGRIYTLHGRIVSQEVKTIVSRTPRQTWCFFTEGFLEFCQENALKVGDELHFKQTEAWDFEVQRI